jgi:hypothetical protein
MAALPKAYMRIARDLTGYWGTYLPWIDLSPGAIGRSSGGVFSQEGHLNQKKGYDPEQHAPRKQTNTKPVSAWTTRNVHMEVLKGQLSGPVQAASGRIRLRFGGANEAAIICNGCRQWLFPDLDAIKALMRQLLRENLWDKEQCLITEVMLVESAWICFATEKGQTAEITGATSFPLPISPLDALKSLAGNAELTASTSNEQSTGFYTTLTSGSTPLFRAIQFRASWLFPEDDTIRNLEKGDSPSREFEEPSFG